MERLQANQQSVRADFAARITPGKSLVIIGGYQLDSDIMGRRCWLLENDGRFIELTNLPEALGRKMQVCTTYAGFAVFNRVEGTCMQYNMQSRKWEALPTIPEKLEFFKATFHQGHISVVGKVKSVGRLFGDTVRFDLVNKNWVRYKLDGYAANNATLVSTNARLIELNSIVHVSYKRKNEITIRSVEKDKIVHCISYPYGHSCRETMTAATSNDSIFLYSDQACVCYNTETKKMETLAMPDPPDPGCLAHDGTTLYLCGWGDVQKDMYIHRYNTNANRWRRTNVMLPEVLFGHRALFVNTM